MSPADIATAVLKRILNRPETYDQAGWCETGEEHPDVNNVLRQPHEEWCGTTACVAGHAVAVAIEHDPTIVITDGFRGVGLEIERIARQALGLTRDQADWLFWSDRPWDDVIDQLEQIRES